MKLIPKYQTGSSILLPLAEDYISKPSSDIAKPDVININKPLMPIEKNPFVHNVLKLESDKRGNFTDIILNNNEIKYEGANDWSKQRKAREQFIKAYNSLPNLQYLTENQQRALADSLYPLSTVGSNWNVRVAELKKLNPDNLNDWLNNYENKFLTLKANQPARNQYRKTNWHK